MKNFDSRAYSINDFVEWEKGKQLELNPYFQRRAVWNEKAKSYLMDTVLRGKPMPKIFIRQKLNITSKSSVREVVDGQQRLRTILSYTKDGFVVNKRHNPEYGGLYFSQLPPDVQKQILFYEISVDLLIDLPDAEILDIFGRLNSYAIVLNDQEKINALHFGEFKVLADELGRHYLEYWTTQGIVTSKNVLRMLEVNLVADLLISMLEGIKPKKSIKKYYDAYEEDFPGDSPLLTGQFKEVIETIGKIYPEGLKNTEFSRVHLFYSLYSTIFHLKFGLIGFSRSVHSEFTESSFQKIRNSLDRISEIFNPDEAIVLTEQEQQFLVDCRRATTDEPVRKRRTEFLLELIGDFA